VLDCSAVTREVCFTRAARSATCARSSSTSVTSAAMCASFASMISRSPVLAACSAATSPGAGGVSGINRTPSWPADRDQDDMPGRPAENQQTAPPRHDPSGTPVVDRDIRFEPATELPTTPNCRERSLS
jgi:hypothetical protein